MLELAIEEQGREVQRRLYAHHDYFGNIIPSSWFVIGTIVGTFVFYRPQLASAIRNVREFVRAFGEPSTGVDLIIAVLLAVGAFNIIYIIGQLLNGVAAVVLDRVIVKKLLKYPFTLYEMKWANRDTGKPDVIIFREAVLTATYGVFCVNLVPVVFFEIALLAFGRENPYAGSWVQRNPSLAFPLVALLVVVHFGIPSLRKAHELSSGADDPGGATLELFVGHLVLLMVAIAIVGLAITAVGFTPVIILLPLANILMAVGDRKMLKKYGDTYKTEAMRRVFQYARRTFVNPSYFAAKLVGYGSGPAAELIGKARTEARYDSSANDFYWMCQLRVENDAPRTYDTAYHGMAMYTMNRNLCNATAFIIVLSLIAFYVHWPDGFRHSPLSWVAVLCAFTYAFFIRYLYLFSGSYSKYVIRVSAFLADREKRSVIAAP